MQMQLITRKPASSTSKKLNPLPLEVWGALRVLTSMFCLDIVVWAVSLLVFNIRHQKKMSKIILKLTIDIDKNTTLEIVIIIIAIVD